MVNLVEKRGEIILWTLEGIVQGIKSRSREARIDWIQNTKPNLNCEISEFKELQ